MGAVISAAGNIMGGYASAANKSYQAQVATNNATIEQQNATYAIQAGQTQGQDAGIKAAEQTGRTQASIGANGIDTTSGSAANVIKSSSEIGALNQETINHNALLQAYGYQTQAVSDTAQSQLDRAEGDQAVTAGYMGAAGGLLGNAPSVGSAPTNAEAAYNTVSSWFGS